MSLKIVRNTLCSGILLTSFFAPSIAEELKRGAYFSAGLGFNKLSDTKALGSVASRDGKGNGTWKHDSGITGDFGIGYDFGRIRTEINYVSSTNKLNSLNGASAKVNAKSSSWFFSTAYDFRAGKKWQPYISAGVGSTQYDLKGSKFVSTNNNTLDINLKSNKDTSTSYLSKLGLTYEISNNFDLYGEGWLQFNQSFQLGNYKLMETTSSGFTLGTRFKF